MQCGVVSAWEGGDCWRGCRERLKRRKRLKRSLSSSCSSINHPWRNISLDIDSEEKWKRGFSAIVWLKPLHSVSHLDDQCCLVWNVTDRLSVILNQKPMFLNQVFVMKLLISQLRLPPEENCPNLQWSKLWLSSLNIYHQRIRARVIFVIFASQSMIKVSATIDGVAQPRIKDWKHYSSSSSSGIGVQRWSPWFD